MLVDLDFVVVFPAGVIGTCAITVEVVFIPVVVIGDTTLTKRLVVGTEGDANQVRVYALTEFVAPLS